MNYIKLATLFFVLGLLTVFTLQVVQLCLSINEGLLFSSFGMVPLIFLALFLIFAWLGYWQYEDKKAEDQGKLHHK